MCYVVIQSPSHVWLFVIPWTAECQAPCPSLSARVCSNSCQLSQWCFLTILSSATPFSFFFQSFSASGSFILCHPLLLFLSIFPSIGVFSNKMALHSRWTKYWSFSFRISLSNEYLGLISFWIDWFDPLAVQGTFKSLL